MKPILILLSLATLASARLGETPAECAKRYGDPVKINKAENSIAYLKAGFFVFVSFHEGKASQIVIMKGTPDAPEKMSEAERDSLLKANAGAGEWKKKEQAFEVDPKWSNAVEKRTAQYSSVNKALFIAALDHLARDAEEKESAEKQNLDGF